MTSPDLSYLPSELHLLEAALDIVTCSPRQAGWLPPAYPDAPRESLRPGAPPDDGVYRASWLSPGVCVRLDLQHPRVPDSLANQLRKSSPEALGSDEALYVYGVDSTSQRDNRDHALDTLRQLVVRAQRADETPSAT